MFTSEHETLLKGLIKAAYQKQVVSFQYVSTGTSMLFTRVVEPYSVVRTGDGVMLRAYQLEPNEGWRFFNTEFMTDLTPVATTFSPRRNALIRIGKELQHLGPIEELDREQSEYEKRVLAVIADMDVTAEEALSLEAFRKEVGLTEEEVRGVHYRVFSQCLASVVENDLITDEELNLLKELNDCLKRCGAGMLD